MKIAVTGTIGSGKSTLCRRLAELLPEFTVISIDDVVRSIYDDADFQAHLWSNFGVASKKEASDLVFANPHKRVALEQLSLGYVRPKFAAALEVDNAIVEFPLLFEMSNYAAHADLVIAVGCDDAAQRERVVARDKMTVEKLMAVRAGQYSRELRAALCDVYVDTGMSVLEQEKVHASIVARVRVLQLKKRAQSLFGDAGATIFDAIEERYTEPQRHYHTMWHLHELFTAMQPHMSGHRYAPAMEMAAWFHDIIYETEPAAYPNNENKSAKEMLRLLNKFLPQWLTIDSPMHEQVYLAAEIIVSTKNHTITADWVRANQERLHAASLFIDADMSILAASTTRLAEYDKQISREWGNIPGEENYAFCVGRLSALRSFKAAGAVFMTQEFAALEEAAQSNISHLVDYWLNRVTMYPHPPALAE